LNKNWIVIISLSLVCAIVVWLFEALGGKSLILKLLSRKEYLKRRWEKDQQKMKKTRRDPETYRFLSHYYSEYPLLQMYGKSFPVTVFQAPHCQTNNIESALGSLERLPDDDFAFSDERYFKLLKASGRKLYNGRLFTIKEIKLIPKLSVECGTGRYFDCQKTCDALEYELLKEFGVSHTQEQNSETISKRLPHRRTLHEKVNDPVIQGAGRSAALAVSVLIVFNHSNEYQALIMKRAGKVAVHDNLFHVIPSFMMEYEVEDFAHEFKVTHNIFREYTEELFDYNFTGTKIFYDYFYSDPRLKFLQEILQRNDASLYYTGITVNLLNLRPEICALLLIRSPDWFVYHTSHQPFKFNWEFLSEREAWEEEKRGLLLVDLYDENTLAKFIMPETVVPPAASAIYLGLALARKILA